MKSFLIVVVHLRRLGQASSNDLLSLTKLAKQHISRALKRFAPASKHFARAFKHFAQADTHNMLHNRGLFA